MSDSASTLFAKYQDALRDLRQQGMQLSDINPISSLADMISDQLYHKQINISDISDMLGMIGDNVWQQRANALAVQTGLKDAGGDDFVTATTRLADRRFDRPLYRAVFTAHPVFALQPEASAELCDAAVALGNNQPIALENPAEAYEPRAGITLRQEHKEAMRALVNARRAIIETNDAVLQLRAQSNPGNWRDELPVMLGVSTWVGYDLDGRSDISWIDSLVLRLSEKQMALGLYVTNLKAIELDPAGHAALDPIIAQLENEQTACGQDIDHLLAIDGDPDNFARAANSLSERPDKLTASASLASTIHGIAKNLADDDHARAVLLVAADMATHGFGMGEIHLRINALQLRNAMRSLDGRSLSVSDGVTSSRLLMERLANRIDSEDSWDINFATVDQETATARRQLMLAAQFLKHVDSDQAIRLLIAECERPITYMTALYLAHKLGLKDKLDISPLFETTFGLEHGASMMRQIFGFPAVQDYLRGRGRVAIQLGFSDAGRFMGQIAANLAIERLQVKLTELCAQTFGNDIELLIFNTHGESLGRGCARPTIRDRQNFILTPFMRSHAQTNGVRIYHQSSFQGGDGYRLFGSDALAKGTITQLVLAETETPSQAWRNDPFYTQNEFALDLFSSLKQWHESLFANPQYGMTLDVFGSNLLPKTGSRPAKRVVQAGNERRDPSKIRAIPHNAILQQLGFLAVVISGIGSAARVDTDQFCEIYQESPRLQQCMDHVHKAKQLGSLNTVLSYARLTDNGYWVSRAYHGTQQDNQRACRMLATHLNETTFCNSMRQTVWKLREDLIDLYRLSERLGIGSVRTIGHERLELDLLHAVRIALITDALVKVSQVPRFSETNRNSNADMVSAALQLDFDTVCAIIEEEFPNNKTADAAPLLEPETYSTSNKQGYEMTQQQLLVPLREYQRHIRLITQMISANYGAHG